MEVGSLCGGKVANVQVEGKDVFTMWCSETFLFLEVTLVK